MLTRFIYNNAPCFSIALLFFFSLGSVAQEENSLSISEGVAAVESQASMVESVIAKLPGAKLKEVAAIVKELEAVAGIQALPLFNALIGGDLFYTKETEKVVVAGKIENSKKYRIYDALSGIEIGTVEKKAIRKVRTNNKLRSNLRTTIARLNLFSGDVNLRRSAVVNMTEKLTAENIALLKKAKELEQTESVIESIDIALAIYQLDEGDNSEKLDAIELLNGDLDPLVRNKLAAVAESEPDKKVSQAASAALKSIEGKIKFYGYLETLFFGLSLGSVLLLVAAGLAITFGVMGVINMAHGEMIMLGAYTTYVIQLLLPNNIALSIFIAIPAAFIVSGLFGVLIERGVIQFLKGRPLETLLATFGISLVLQQLVRTVFSPLNRQVATPEFMSGALEINSVFSITYNRLYILIFALLVFFVLQLILKKTSLGLNVRAVSQNRDMAKAMGIRTEWVDALTFGLGSGIAGLAGVALSQITNVGPNLGQAYIIDSFMVVVFGGVGNLWGTLVGGFSLGVLNKFLEPATGAVLANIIVLVGIILFIQKRPRGLFPQKGRAAES
ncbi:MAG: urea ABC transporter permease subunit UrtB [Cellvibrionaceae bacterium]